MQFFISASHIAELSYFDFMHGFSCRFMQNSFIIFFASFRWTDATWYIFHDVLVVFALLIITLVCGFSFNQQYLIAIGFFMKNLCSDLPLSLSRSLSHTWSTIHFASRNTAHSLRYNCNSCLYILTSMPNTRCYQSGRTNANATTIAK